MDSMNILNLALIPAVMALLGGVVGLFYRPKATVLSLFQHLAAGVVFAAVAVELIPQIVKAHEPVSLTVGFVLGVLLMIGIAAVGGGHGDHDDDDTAGAVSVGFIAAIAIDLFIDGALISIAAVAGERGGLLISIALAIEILFLSLTTSLILKKAKLSNRTSLLTTLMLTACILLGALGGYMIIMALPPTALNALLAFGIAALLYLVTEELLVEAHEVKETPLITAAFFLGFFLIFLVDTQF